LKPTNGAAASRPNLVDWTEEVGPIRPSPSFPKLDFPPSQPLTSSTRPLSAQTSPMF